MSAVRIAAAIVLLLAGPANDHPAVGATGAGNATGEEPLMQGFERVEGTRWEGSSELWLDPLGNEALVSEASLEFRVGEIHYRWDYQGEPQTGIFRPVAGGMRWQDSWHQPEPVLCQRAGAQRGLFAVEYAYPAEAGPDWTWRIVLSQRPDESLVLQMTNITPWGEEGRAVRMVLAEQGEAER